MGTAGSYLYRPAYGEYGYVNYGVMDAALSAADSELTACNIHRLGTSRDDHTQYSLANGTRAYTGALTGTSLYVTNVYATTVTATSLTSTYVLSTVITGDSISAALFSGTNVKVTTVTATNVSASEDVRATTVTATTVSGTNFKATTITATTVSGTDLSSTNVKATTITATTVSGTDLSSTNVKATTISATTVSGTDLSSTNVKATTITATTITATTFSGTDVKATTITATNISATNITATAVTATNITATDISASTYHNIMYSTIPEPLSSVTISATLFSGTNVYITTLTATNISATTYMGFSLEPLTATNIYGTTITATNISATTYMGFSLEPLTATNMSATTFSGTYVKVTTLTATNVSAASISATTISATTYDNLPDPGYSNLPAYLIWGSCIWISSLNFGVQGSISVSGTVVNIPYTVVTLDAADPTNARIDLIILESDGTADKITGTPASEPSEPDYDTATQVKLTIVTIPAGATEPPSVTVTTLYDENNDWTYADSGATIVADSTTSPHAGTYCIEATNPVPSNWFSLTFGGTAFDLNTYDWLSLWIKPKAAFGTRYLRLRWASTGTSRGSYVSIAEGSFGFNSSSATWQNIVIPTSMFAVPTSNTINRLNVWFMGGTGAHSGWSIDDVVLQIFEGTTPPGGTTDHGALAGLGDDDHTQYSLADGTRAYTGAVTGTSIKATTITATTLSGATLSGGNVYAAAITATNFSGTTFSGTNSYVTTVTATTVTATTISSTVYQGLSYITWTDVTGTSVTMSANNGYVANNAGIVSATLPGSAGVGAVLEIVGYGAGMWKLVQAAGQTVHFGNLDSTTGATGYLSATNAHDCVRLMCVATSTDYVVIGAMGNIVVV